ncbi:hypothetical protein G9A89_005404 [Geosiphon pyriformis]|nr:hypothetical protein G9A89_005404 [Geosiphon pyriformis]
MYNGQKVAFGPADHVLLDLFELNAMYSSMAYCLSAAGGHEMTPGFLAKTRIRQRNRFHKDLIISFQGTGSILDWPIVSSDRIIPTRKQWENKKYDMVEFERYQDVLVDKAFYSVFINGVPRLQNLIIKALKSRKCLECFKTITFTGHGLGGVFAVLSALKFGDLLKKYKVEVFTYGQPPIGNVEFSKLVSQLVMKRKLTTYRITHSDDYVPRIHYMLRNTAYLYQHAYEIWIDGDCDCVDNKPTIYICEGPISDGNLRETMACNLGTKTKGEFSNLGPYFGHKMGKCPVDDD